MEIRIYSNEVDTMVVFAENQNGDIIDMIPKGFTRASKINSDKIRIESKMYDYSEIFLYSDIKRGDGTAAGATINEVFAYLQILGFKKGGGGGEMGPQGEQGIQGIQGEQGEQGIQGIQGEQGTNGASVTRVDFIADVNGEAIIIHNLNRTSIVVLNLFITDENSSIFIAISDYQIEYITAMMMKVSGLKSNFSAVLYFVTY